MKREPTRAEIIVNELKQFEIITGQRGLSELSKATALELVSLMESEFSRHPWMNKTRIKTILSDGMRGKFGDVFGLNLRTIMKWIDGYFQNNQHQIKVELAQAQKVETEPTEEEKNYWLEVGRENFRDKWALAKEGGTILPLFDWGVYWFDKFKKNGLLIEERYNVQKIIDDERRRQRLITRQISETVVGYEVKNSVWKLFVREAISKKVDLTKYIND